MRLYLDNNVYNRPFDDQRIGRNRVETQAIEELLRRVAAGDVDLVSSFVIDTEHSFLPLGVRRAQVGALIRGLTKERVRRTPSILRRAEALKRAGIAEQDALHVGEAEQAQVDYFVTCDDKLLKRARRAGTRVVVVSPLDLFEEGVL